MREYDRDDTGRIEEQDFVDISKLFEFIPNVLVT